MDLERLEVKNHRSIKSQWGENAIEFEGLDCLVGKNNVGKTNIISAIKYLLEEEDKDKDEELYWNKDTSRTVEVRGYFQVLEEDLERIEDEEKRAQVRDLLLNDDGFNNHLGICRTTESEEEDGNTLFQVIQLRPVDDELNEDAFLEFRDDRWEETDEEGFTKTDYRDAMQEKYPEVAEHVDEDSLKQKGAWKDGYKQYIDSKPDDLEFEPRPTDFPTGTKQLIRDDVLPDVIKIPAIKDVEDAAQASGELGEMTDALYSELEEDINEQLDEQLGGVYERLDNSSESFESRISDYLKQAFRDYSVNLDFPRVESRRLFRDVGIRIEDEQLEDTLSHENVGEGVRRVLVFSMLRTIADLRDGSLSISNGDEEDGQRQPLLILYEEAELFLHPNLQKNLLRVFRSLTEGDAQIIFNTHSPVLIQNEIIDTINIVRDHSGTEVTQFHTVLNERDPGEHSRLMDLQKVSSYIFSDRVVLVEGRSDAIVLRKLATALDPNWEFESHGIPVLPVGGKDELPLFKDFLEDLGIDVLVMADIGALRSTVHSLVEEGFPHDEIEDLKETSNSLVEDGEVEHSWNSSDISSKILNATWEKTFERYKELKRRLEEGEEVEEEHIDSLKKLINKKSNDAWREAIGSDHERINAERVDLRARILEDDILVLNGEIEDYYPDVEVRNKTEAALEFSPEDYSIEELRDQFTELPARGETDIEVFFERVFEE
jgi:putative ATP-dependent endonuclease of OLD family